MTREQEFRRRWYEAHRDRFVADEQRYQQAKTKADGFPKSAAEALGLLADLARTGDLESFKKRTQAWAVKPTTLGFKGTIGQMMLNIFVNRADEPERVARLLVESLGVPASDDEAVAKIGALANYSKSIKRGSTPALMNVPFVTSYFWGLADHDRWPVLWPSAAEYIQFSTGESLPADPPERYQSFLDRVREISSDNHEFEMTAGWWDNDNDYLLDEVLCDRAKFGLDNVSATEQELRANAQALVGIADAWGHWLQEEIGDALGDDLKVSKPKIQRPDGSFRNDLWVDVHSKQGADLRLRVWVNHLGAAVGLFPGFRPKGWREEVTSIVEAADYPDCEVLGGRASDIGRDVGFHGSGYVYGRWFEREQLAEVELTETILEVADLLTPLYDELFSLGLGDEATTDPDDPLEPLVKQYLAESGYPTPDDEVHRAKREEFEALLAPDVPFELKRHGRVWNTREYGNPGSMPEINRSFNGADKEEHERMVDAIHYLCWGEGPDSERIDRMLSDQDRRISGLAESVTMKFLAITHPETYLPVFPYSGPKGKGRILQILEIEEPTGSRGEIQVASNQAIRDRVERFFPGDPWGMSRFLYWYLERNDEETEDDSDVLGELADELLIDRSFLDDIEALLEKKRQVILYGPPGTGKTHLAREMAKTLVPDADRRVIVQFHPSSSYEDFFEGYRPEEGKDGSLTYRLKLGPLARMAEKARSNPDQKHIMIIDEINRANLPKVLGELLYLFEYRDERVQTLYRPDEGFLLPRNLWFIGTMNTADRSIALVDAALRRRFHFVPFFPNRWPIEDLLKRWLEAKGEPTWVAELVAQVNDELKDELGGSHLLLGPSYFMQENLDEQAVRRIWEYNIEPFIEDQFFDNSEQIDMFRFNEVLKRYREESGIEETAEVVAEEQEISESDSDSGGEMQ